MKKLLYANNPVCFRKTPDKKTQAQAYNNRYRTLQINHHGKKIGSNAASVEKANMHFRNNLIYLIDLSDFYSSKLLGLSRKSSMPIVTIPDSSRRILIFSRTRMIFLKESFTFRKGRRS